ncbi:MAG: glycosyltransferase [Holophagaceae bacterium]|nr:glycosyltransferase [Holophagaceae bacterium]
MPGFRLLVVSPHFPPVNTADMQRVRMLLPFFRELGWEVEVLAVAQEAVAAPLDPWLEAGLPSHVPVHRVKVLGRPWSRLPGLGTLGLRALRALDRAGSSLLAKGGFDLVYFSTTVFEVHLLGPRWKRRFGVPFVLDYQDPWVNDYYRKHPEVRPPGGRLKYAAMDALHRWMEPRVLRHCAGITAVSADYPTQLALRYPEMVPPRVLVEGFPGAERDFQRLGGLHPQCSDGLGKPCCT